MSYSLWAFETHERTPLRGVNWTALSIALLTLALLRYAMRIDTGDAGEPEDVVMGDRVLPGARRPGHHPGRDRRVRLTPLRTALRRRGRVEVVQWIGLVVPEAGVKP